MQIHCEAGAKDKESVLAFKLPQSLLVHLSNGTMPVRISLSEKRQIALLMACFVHTHKKFGQIVEPYNVHGSIV